MVMKINNFNYIRLIRPGIVKHNELGYMLYVTDPKNIKNSIYIIITEKLFKEYNGKELVNFFNNEDNSEFELGTDYYVSKSMAQDMDIPEEYVLDDLVDEDFEIADSFEIVNTSVENIQRLFLSNELNGMTFNEEEVMSFASTFATLLLDYSELQNPNNIYNTIYKHVLEWLQNNQTDNAMTLLNLIFGGKVTVINGKLSNCGCSSSSESSTSSISCYDAYIEALNSWVATMFGDLNFYYDWFFVSTNDEENEPNEEMIDMLISLIEELKLMKLSLDNDSSRLHNCGCLENTIDTSYIDILNNYIKVLNFIKNCQIEQNTNKIKLWGKEFGGILPKLMFS